MAASDTGKKNTGRKWRLKKGSGETRNGQRVGYRETGSGETWLAEVAVASRGQCCSTFLCQLAAPCKGMERIEVSTRKNPSLEII